MADLRTGFALTALRGSQGSRTMYLVLERNSVLNTFFTTEMEPLEDRSQRQIDPKHARDIGSYILRNPSSYALGAITYAVDTDGEFEELQEGTDIGILRLPLSAKLRSIDGQHRRLGIKQAIDENGAVGNDHTALLIYVEHDLTKRRQMFSDMNNTPKKVSKALNVSYDSRDPFARVVKNLVKQDPLLKDRVETESARVGLGSPYFYTLASVHDASKRLFVGPSGRVRDTSKFEDAEILGRASSFFELLGEARSEFKEAADQVKLDKLRNETLLFSSTTLRVIAGAVWTVLGPEMTAGQIRSLATTLRSVDFGNTAKIWLDCGFVSPGKTTPNARTQELLSATNALADLLKEGK